MFQKKDKSGVSLPEAKKVCGYEIKKMPIAPYLVAIEKLTGFIWLQIRQFRGKTEKDKQTGQYT